MDSIKTTEQFKEAAVDAISSHAISWAASNGLQVGRGESPPRFTHVPFSLLPQALPQQAFEKAVAVAPTFGNLVHRVSQDSQWLQTNLEEVCQTDEFTKRLVDILKAVDEEGLSQSLCLGIHRSDYMLHDPSLIEKEGPPTFLQVELNTIASSFGCLSARVAQLHRHLIQRFQDDLDSQSGTVDFLQFYLNEIASRPNRKRKHEADLPTETNRWSNALPLNPTLHKLPSAVATAHQLYGQAEEGGKAVVIFVVQDGETNVMDQRLFEFQLWEDHQIPVRRMSLGEIQRRCTVKGEKRRLMIDGTVEVAVVYFRAGYTPDDYPTESEWEGRLLIERSHAIKCPNIGYHLTGTKKVQQILTKPEELSKFMSEEESTEISSTFAGLFSLGSDAGEATKAAMEECLENPDLYVLKPQREGGGNNLYAEELVDKLKNAKEGELQEYVLMERFFPRAQNALLLREGEVMSGPSVSELGIYSTFIGDKDEVHMNEYAGYLLRTKLQNVKEGGVASGYAVLSSPLLVSSHEN